jgi:hypothetical protein
MKLKLLLLSALLLACDPAQEIATNAVLDTCSDTSEKHVEFLNVEAITYTLPATPKVNCGITYAILGGAAVTFNGGNLSIKGDGQPVATSLVRTTAGTGRLVWNGLHWVHLGGG